MQWRFDEYVELFRGKIMRMSPAPLRQHQNIGGNIFAPIKSYLRRKSCKVYAAPFDVRLPGKNAQSDEKIYTVIQPDVCIICDSAKLDVRGCIGAPDTIIEILSQGTFDRDIRVKFDLYQEYEVPEYWIVLPGEQTVLAFQLNKNRRYMLCGEYYQPGPIPIASLPGFSLLWEDIFED